MLKELRNISGGALGWVKQEQFHDALDCTRHTMSAKRKYASAKVNFIIMRILRSYPTITCTFTLCAKSDCI